MPARVTLGGLPHGTEPSPPRPASYHVKRASPRRVSPLKLSNFATAYRARRATVWLWFRVFGSPSPPLLFGANDLIRRFSGMATPSGRP